jgi:transposase
MEHQDARKLSSAAKHERRRQVIWAHKRGRSRSQIAAEVGLSYTAVINTLNRYAEAGMSGLASAPKGRPVCSGRSHSKEQEERVQQLIQEKRPE